MVTKRNEALSKELLVTKTEAENGMRWTRSSILLENMHKNRTSEKHGIGFDRTSSQVKNPNIDCLCMHCGLEGHKSHNCQRKQTAHNKNLKSLRKLHHEKSIEQKQIPKVKSLPRWARRNLIHPFPKHKSKWIWVPNLIPKIKLQGSVKRKQQQWYLDSACSRHMTGDKRSSSHSRTSKEETLPLVMEKVVKFRELERLDQWIFMQLRTYTM